MQFNVSPIQSPASTSRALYTVSHCLEKNLNNAPGPLSEHPAVRGKGCHHVGEKTTVVVPLLLNCTLTSMAIQGYQTKQYKGLHDEPGLQLAQFVGVDEGNNQLVIKSGERYILTRQVAVIYSVEIK